MSASILLQLVGIFVIGIAAQWVAWRVRLPSILLLLAAGTIAGPLWGWLRPDALFGELLMPIVSLSVAVILYEGGLSLKLRELKQVGVTFVLMSTVGVAVTWIVAAASARWLLGYPWPVAVLLGAILVVTGPTVIGPMLRHLRLRGKVSSLLKWEGIVVDPLGAMLAVSVFAVLHAGTLHSGIGASVAELGRTFVIGTLTGCLVALVLMLAISRYWIPDVLHNPVSLALMFVAFSAANYWQEESGLLAVTVMGIVMANQNRAVIRHITEFKETLTVLLISCLFIVLAARLELSDLSGLDWRSFAFVAVLIFVARPASMLAATIGSKLTWQERCFLCCMAPRGIVAAAITSLFSTSLVAAGFPRATEMVPVTFLVVFSTVLLYGAISRPLALRLGLIQSNPQGILFVGAEKWVRTLASILQQNDYHVFLVDTDWNNVRQCRAMGLPALYGSAMAETTREEIDYAGLGKLLSVTSNDEVNALACVRYFEDFGRRECYQLSLPAGTVGKHEAVAAEHRGRFLFGEQWDFFTLHRRAGDQPTVKKTKLTEEFDFAAFQSQHDSSVLPLCIAKANGSLVICTASEAIDAQPGDTIFGLVTSADPSGGG